MWVSTHYRILRKMKESIKHGVSCKKQQESSRQEERYIENKTYRRKRVKKVCEKKIIDDYYQRFAILSFIAVYVQRMRCASQSNDYCFVQDSLNIIYIYVEICA